MTVRSHQRDHHITGNHLLSKEGNNLAATQYIYIAVGAHDTELSVYRYISRPTILEKSSCPSRSLQVAEDHPRGSGHYTDRQDQSYYILQGAISRKPQGNTNTEHILIMQALRSNITLRAIIYNKYLRHKEQFHNLSLHIYIHHGCRHHGWSPSSTKSPLYENCAGCPLFNDHTIIRG